MKAETLLENYQALSELYSNIRKELDRTRKALDVAVDALKSAHEYYQNCVIREKQPHEINWYCTAMNMDNDISKALEQITALTKGGDNE